MAIKNLGSTIAPAASIALPFLAPGLSKNIGKATTAVSAVGQVESAVNNTVNSAKNAAKNNPYYNKLNSNPYQEKFASEEEHDENKKKRTKALAKAAPYVAGTALLLAYGTQAIKDKSLVTPAKKSISSVPGATVEQFKKKSNTVKGLVNGAKKGLKEANNITVVQQKKTPLNSLVNGAAWGSGVLGVHLLGDAFFKNKQKNVAKSYKRSQPALVKTVETAKEIKEMIDNHKKSEDRQEKTAAAKNEGFWGEINQKALDNNINLKRVWNSGVKYPAATALAVYAGKEIVSKGNKLIRERARKDYLQHLERKRAKEKKKEMKADNGNEKTAGVKEDLKKYIRNYGEANLKSVLKPISAAAVTVPLVYGSEILKQRKITKKINERNAEREKQEQERKNNGRNYKGGERDRNSEHNV